LREEAGPEMTAVTTSARKESTVVDNRLMLAK